MANISTQQDLWSRLRWVIVLAGAVAVAGVVVGATQAAQAGETRAQRAEISSMEAQLNMAQSTQSETIESAVQEGLGVSPGRVSADTAVITEFATLSFEWDSGESYEEAREHLKSEFGLTETDDYLVTFLPPSRYNQDAEGKRYYYLDAVGLNTTLGGDVEVAVVSVDGTKYRYAVFVDTVVTADGPVATDERGEPRPQPEATRRVMLMMTVDADGTISEISGIPPSGSTRASS